MDNIYGVLYVFSIITITCLFGLKCNWSRLLSVGEFFVYFLIIFYSIFFFIFYLLGAVELLANQSNLSITNALSLAIIVAGAMIFNFSRAASLSYCLFPIFDKPPPLRLQAKIVKYLTLSVYLILAGLLILGFPRGFEVWAYHLPIGINIFQKGSLQIWDQAYMHTFPANMSIWDGFWLQILPERLISVVNLPYLAMCVFFLYQLCRLVGADRSASWLVACGLTTIPLFGFSALELGADVAGVAFIIVAVYLVLARPNVKPGWCFMSGLAAGLAYGFKASHLIPSTLLVIFILIGQDKLLASSYLVRFKQVLKFAIAFLLMAGIWLLRNYIELGNPTYPVHFGSIWDALGFKAAPDFVISDRTSTQFEWVHTSWEWLIYPWVEWHNIGQNYKHSSGLGAFFAATVPVTWLGFTLMLITDEWKIKKDKFQFSVILYLLGTILVAIWWFLGDRQPRYIMAGIALLLPITALFITEAGRRLRKSYELVLIFGISFMFIVLLVRLGVVQGALITSNGLASRSMAFEYPSIIDKLENGSTILDLEERTWHYPLYGAQLSNRVVSYPEAERLFRQDNSWNLNSSLIRQLGITHIYVHGNPKLIAGCVEIKVAENLDRNPFNGIKLDKPHILYRVIDHCS
ncbi:MAG: hypothetical protein Q7U66_08745 [Methylobacter sp.]|nr:hypothetical protein [Methylobacter sp.]